MNLIKPKALKSGDLVRVIAPSSSFDRDRFLAGIKILEAQGFRVVYRKDVFAKLPYLAGTDARRLRELTEALEDENCRAICFARGGYGSMRLIEALTKTRLKPTPKIVAGFSDATPLHLYLQKRFGWTMFYAPVIGGNMGQLEDAFTRESFFAALTSAKALAPMRYDETVVVRKGSAEGRLTGGCLTLLAASLGTPYELDTDGKILFFEDVHEKPYQVDRLLTHLKLAGKFKKCRGVICGGLSGPNPFEHYQETVADVLRGADFPILMNFPTGHIKRTATLPLGVKVRLDAGKKTLTFLEGALG